MGHAAPADGCAFVALCGGSDCARERREAFCALRDELGDRPVVLTRCLGVCHGPVAVVRRGDKTWVLERVRTAAQRRALRQLAAGGGRRAGLHKVKGKAKRKALRRTLGAAARAA